MTRAGSCSIERYGGGSRSKHTYITGCGTGFREGDARAAVKLGEEGTCTFAAGVGTGDDEPEDTGEAAAVVDAADADAAVVVAADAVGGGTNDTCELLLECDNGVDVYVAFV
jgi:hypothetical protein